jgi:hypothetical protein
MGTTKSDISVSMGIDASQMQRDLAAIDSNIKLSMNKSSKEITNSLNPSDLKSKFSAVLDQIQRDIANKLVKTLNDKFSKIFSTGVGEISKLLTILLRIRNVIDNVKTQSIWGKFSDFPKPTGLIDKTIGAFTSKFPGLSQVVLTSINSMIKPSATLGTVFSATIGEMLASLSTLTLGIAAVVVAFIAAAFAIKDWARSLTTLSVQLGNSVGEILSMQRALINMNASVDDAASLMTTLRDHLYAGNAGFNDTISALNMLGIAYSDIKNLNPAAQFELIAKAINSHGNAVQRAALATTIFGKEGAKAVASYKEQTGWLLKMTTAMNEYTEANLAIQAESVSNFSDSWNRTKTEVMDLVRIIGSALAPLLTFILDIFNAILAVVNAIASIAGLIVNRFLEAARLFVSGQWGELMSEKFATGKEDKQKAPLGRAVITQYNELRKIGGGIGPTGYIGGSIEQKQLDALKDISKNTATIALKLDGGTSNVSSNSFNLASSALGG